MRKVLKILKLRLEWCCWIRDRSALVNWVLLVRGVLMTGAWSADGPRAAAFGSKGLLKLQGFLLSWSQIHLRRPKWCQFLKFEPRFHLLRLIHALTCLDPVMTQAATIINWRYIMEELSNLVIRFCGGFFVLTFLPNCNLKKNKKIKKIKPLLC